MAKKFVKREITPEIIKSFLEGNDPQERIVNLEYSYQNDYITVFYRDEQDRKLTSRESFLPFVWAKRTACESLFRGDRTKTREEMIKYGIWCRELDTTDTEGNVVDEMKDGYCFLFYAIRPMSYQKFLEFFKHAGVPVYSTKKASEQKSFTDQPIAKKYDKQYLAVTPQEQFLISTGKRFFKGYEDYDGILRLIIDLETTGLNTKTDKIEQIGIHFNRKVRYKGEFIEFEKILATVGDTEEERCQSELNNIVLLLKIIKVFKPDVITAHNGEAFDFNMLFGAAERLGYDLTEVSKELFDGNGMYKDPKESTLKLGGEIEHYNRTVIPYTIVLDSLHAVRRAQALDSNMLFSNLKYVTKYSKIVKVDRVYVPGDRISDIWNDKEHLFAFNEKDGDWYIYDPNYVPSGEYKRGKDGNSFTLYTKHIVEDGYMLVSGEYIVGRYLLDDLWECDKVEHRYNTPNFLICKMLPVPFQKCCTMGTAGQWKALMLAWSWENGLAIPSFSERRRFTGGLSRLLKVGFVDKVAKFDYNSLYPSIILTWGISDAKDLMHAMLYFLEHVLTEREKYKDLKKAASKKVDEIKARIESGNLLPNDEEELRKWMEATSANDKKQLPLKILGNSFFGSYGAPNVFPWASVDCAERTTCTGRQSLRLMIYYFKNLGYEPIVGDTDGFNFKLPEDDKYRYTAEHPYVSPGLSRVTKKDFAYIGFKADVAEFNDLYMCDKHYTPNAVNKMGLGIDEIVDATINFSRKNYADYFPENTFPEDVKMVGNTIKSKKMPEYISKFLEKGIRQLLRKKGQEFIESYYDYIDKIYNYQIPLKLIASKGKIKKSIEQYKEDCLTITKAGRPKSRQAWMELAIREEIDVNMGETIYYVNTGKSKSEADVKKVKHFYKEDGLFNEKKDMKVAMEKEYKAAKKEAGISGREVWKDYPNIDEYVKAKHPDVTIEDEIILNCRVVPREVIESEVDILCEDGQEYNVPKYIDQFNSRIKPLLVCFQPEIRDKILITNPENRQYFTYEQCELCCGFPNKEGDQDTYEQLMTMEDKEIVFWMSHPEWEIPFLKECGMDWDKIVTDYKERMAREKELGINFVRDKFEKVLNEITTEVFDEFEDGEIPSSLSSIIDIDPKTGNFISKDYPDIVIGTIYDVFDAYEESMSRMEAAEEIAESAEAGAE